MLEKQTSLPNGDEQERLGELLRLNRVIKFFEDIPDKDFSFITCSVYGSPKSNELFVRLTNGRCAFVEAVVSRLAWPPMADRIFGMDELDKQDAFSLADRMWSKYQKQLLAGSQSHE
jgi:hypothetical protein